MRSPLVLALAASVALAGCATTESGSHNIVDDVRLMWGSDDGLTPEQKALREGAREHASTRMWGAVTGVLVGAAGGALTASALDVDPVTGLFVGATAGALVGYAGGAYVASKNAAAADQQAALRNQIAGANADADRYADMAANARVVVAKHEQEIARLNADFAANRVSADTYREQIRTLEGDAASIKALLIESEGNIALMERDIAARQAAGQSTVELAAAKARLEAENAELRESWVQLVEAIGTIPPAVGGPVVS
jgi:hypothetical protein